MNLNRIFALSLTAALSLIACCTLTIAVDAAPGATPKPTAPGAIIVVPPERAAGVVSALGKTLRSAGYAVQTAGFDAALAPGAFNGISLVVLADATLLPVDLHAPLERHLHAGGDLMAFGLPAWKSALLRVNGRWVSEDEYARANAWKPAQRPAVDFAKTDPGEWTRATDPDAGRTTYEIATVGPGRRALHAVLPDLTSWDTFSSPALQKPFPDGSDRTVFSAKGGPRTKSLALEWTETDGSRWIATVPLTTEWKRYELAPDAFRYWASNPSRGGGGDAFRPQNAARFSVGLAFSHTGSIGGRHEYWFANIGTAPAEDAPLSGLHLAEQLDGLYPAWKSFPVRDVARLEFQYSPAQDAKRTERVTFPVRSPHPRPSGSGFDKGRRVRFVPLVEARSKDGFWRGAPGAAYVHTEGKYKGSVWTVYGIPASACLANPSRRASLDATLRWMRGPHLAEGGSVWYTCFPGDPVRLGARVAGEALTRHSVRISVMDTVSRAWVWSREWPADAPAITAEWTPPSGGRGPWQIETELRAPNGRVVDRIGQTVHVWAPREVPHFITADGGRFLLDGKPWKAHGVNYMPSSGVARDQPDDQEEFEHWIGKAAYDTAIVQRDLDNIKRMGMNAVSIFIYGGSVDSGNLLDILRLCHARGIKANVSLRPGTPLDFQWDQIRPIIERFRLATNAVVFMYDLAWEPQWGNREARAKYDALWTEWVGKKHGSLEAAERAWGYTPERSGDTLRNPEDLQTVREGSWTKMVVDYRRFLNSLLDEFYGRARSLVRSVDPNHLVSFRMTETSNPTYNWDASLPYDFEGLKGAVDLFGPEAYGRRGEWEAVKPGWFQVQYARAVNPALPVIWAEAGENIWEAGTDEAPPERQAVQSKQFAAFYEMMEKSGSNGIFWWWYPGGYRTNENSDYGILNPDGTDRPATKVIRDNALRFLASPAPVPTNAEVRIRTDYARGLFGSYEDTRDEFWQKVEQGKSPRLLLERGE